MPTGYLTDCMEQSHFWEANTHPSHLLKKFYALLTHQFHYGVQNIPPPVRILNRKIRVNAPTLLVTFVLILSSIYVFLPNELFPSATDHQSVGISTHIYHKHSNSHSPFELPWKFYEYITSVWAPSHRSEKRLQPSSWPYVLTLVSASIFLVVYP